MKKLHSFFLFTIVVFVFTSCKQESEIKTTAIDFENTVLSEVGYTSQTFKVGDVTFRMNGKDFWEGGIACTNHSDVTTATYLNQYSSIVGKGAYDSKKYGVIYAPATIVCLPNQLGAFSAKSLMLTNSTYTYYVIKDGNTYSKKFTTNDWFKVKIDGYFNNQVTSLEYYLADFRNGNSFISNKWENLDISKLGQVDSIKFTLQSTDTGDWGMNTPAYLCIDNLQLTQKIED